MPQNIHKVKAKDAIKVFIYFGGIEKKGKGDHINIKMPNGMIVTVPGEKELKMGLLKNAIKKAGISEKQFLEALQ